MKLTGFLAMALLVHASFSGDAQTVTFSGKDVPLKQVFSIIKKQTGTLFFYDEALMADSKPVSVHLKNVSLEAALDAIFREQPFTWVLEDKTVTISIRSAPVTAGLSNSAIRIRGIVTDEHGDPVPDVTVIVKGTSRGTNGDESGRFHIDASQTDILIFSSLSHATKEVKVEGADMAIQMQLDVKPLEAVLVGGNFSPLKKKEDATAVTIIDSKTLEKLPVNTLDQIFRGLVPATNSFDAGSDLAGFPTLSIRGTGGQSSISRVAVYIDGIEYAGGSGYLFQLDKSNIDRIEIVRGPGASTMYGTGSNGGIVQIFTKKAKTGHIAVNVSSAAGFYKSKWVESNPFQQVHSLEVATGLKNVVLTLGGSYRTVGAYLPDGGERNKGFYLDAKFNLGKLQANFIGRYNVRNFSISRDPFYDTAIHPRTDILIELSPGNTIPAYEYFGVKPSTSKYLDGLTETYVAGVNLAHYTSKNWVNKLDAGYTSNDNLELPQFNGITPLSKQYVSDRFATTTVRYSNTLTLGNRGNDLAATIISGLEYKRNSNQRTYTRAVAATTLLDKDPDNENYGAFAQLNPAYKNVYLTLGLRYEKNELFKAALNPRLGITTNVDWQSFTFKPKISWGKGIAAPAYADRFGTPANAYTVRYPNPDIKPQSQQGFDYGLEVYDQTGKCKLEIVYYDNVLKNMIGVAGLGLDTSNPNIGAFISVNAAEIVNRGWEFSWDYYTTRFSIQATFSIINSLIEDTTGSYLFQSNAVPGVRLDNLPKHTAGIFLTYHFLKLLSKADRGSVSFNVTEVDGVKSFDYRSYYLDVAYGRTSYDPNTPWYAIENSPVFSLGFYADYEALKGLRFFTQGSNILNSYKHELTNDYLTHGATWLFGLQYSFVKSSQD